MRPVAARVPVRLKLRSDRHELPVIRGCLSECSEHDLRQNGHGDDKDSETHTDISAKIPIYDVKAPEEVIPHKKGNHTKAESSSSSGIIDRLLYEDDPFGIRLPQDVTADGARSLNEIFIEQNALDSEEALFLRESTETVIG